MDTAAARERVFRLEEDRDLLLKAWQALDTLDRNAATECHRITRAPEFTRTFERIGEQLTALDEEQSALIASLQSADSGWKGGNVHGWVARLFRKKTQRALTSIGAVLHERVEQRAREMGLSVRQVVEAALDEYLVARDARRAQSRRPVEPRPCPVCRTIMVQRVWENPSQFHARRTCGKRCGGILATGGTSPPPSDAQIRYAVGQYGYRGAAERLSISRSTVSVRMRAIREREARKAA